MKIAGKNPTKDQLDHTIINKHRTRSVLQQDCTKKRENR